MDLTDNIKNVLIDCIWFSSFIIDNYRRMVYLDEDSNSRYAYFMLLDDEEFTIDPYVFDTESGKLYNGLGHACSYYDIEKIENKIDKEKMEYVIYMSNIDTNAYDNITGKLCIASKNKDEELYIPVFSDLSSEEQKEVVRLIVAEAMLI